VAKVYAQNGHWILDYTDAQGRHRPSIGKIGILSERDARRIEKQKNLELSAGYRMLAPKAVPLFEDWANDYLDWHQYEYPHSHFRIRQLTEDHLIPYFGADFIDAIEPKKAEDFKVKRLDEKLARGTVIKEVRTLKAILQRAVELKLIAEHPLSVVSEPSSKNSRPPPFYTVEQLTAVYLACVEVWHAAAWRLYANTGMRRTEGLILKTAWVKKDELHILSTDEERTKAGHWRAVPLNTPAKAALEALKPFNVDGYVLPRVAPESLSRAFIKCARRAKVGGSLHWLRHSYGTHLVANGVNVRTVQHLMGHENITTTERYLHILGSSVAEAAHAISL
jgi:integrase